MASRLPHLFCFGLGYCAQALASRLLAEGWRVTGTRRSVDGAPQVLPDGIRLLRFDRAHPVDPAILAEATHILVSTGPDPADGADPVLAAQAADLAGLAPDWVGYLSTTGVYGDRQGAWVDETSPVDPTSQRAARRIAAEQGWLATGLPVHLFRLAGIYGPGRNALETVRAGQAQRVVKPGQVFCRIHRDDIVAALTASIGRPAPGRVYNLADDEPAPPQDVIAFACALLGIAAPPEIPFDAAVLSPMARAFYADNRRVANRRLRDELGVRLAYPTYRDGLRALMAASTS